MDNSNSTGTTANTAPYILASNRIDLAEIDEFTSRLTQIAQRERQLLHDLTDSIEAILNQPSSRASRPTVDTGFLAQQITCTVCLENQRDCVLEPCMHVCCCISCLQRITDNKCPVCRTPIDFYLKLYIC
jgi:hypothetical protein